MPEIAAEEVAAVPEFVAAAPDVAADEMVDEEYRDEASASTVTAGPEDLMPPPPAFVVPPMEWLLGGPSAGWLIDDPERDFSDEEFAAPPPPPSPQMYYYMRHGFGPCLPSPTPSDEDPEYFGPPDYIPVPELSSPSTEALMDAQPPLVKTDEVDAAPPARAHPTLPDLNLPAPEVEEEKMEGAAPPLTLPTPSPKARVLLRRFAAAMAARPAGIRRGTWCPESLGLTGRVKELRPDDDPGLPSASVAGTSRR